MSDLYVRRTMDYVFDFGTTAGSAGTEYRTGQATAYYVDVDNQQLNEYQNDNTTVMEVEGVEIIGPYTGTYREQLGAVRLVIDGHSTTNVTFNELNAPPFLGNSSNVIPEFRDGNVCTNLGKAMLAGGSPYNATPKIGPGQNLEVAVTLAKTTDGGSASITTPMIVRLHVCEVKGEDKLAEVLTHYGALANGQVDQSFEIGDIENLENNPIKTITKAVPGAGETFMMADWSRLHGGTEADKPFIENYIGYAQNAAATIANEWYEFTMTGNKVNNSWQELAWNFDKKEAVKITHLGLLSHTNAEALRLYKSGRSKLPEYRIQPTINPLPMPLGLHTDNMVFNGPAKLGRGFWVWNEKASIQVKDTGTVIPAWSTTPTRGVKLQWWGKRIELRGDE